MTLLRRIVCCLVALLGAIAVQGTALADSWPSRPIRMVVAFPPGQNTDIVARYFAAKLSILLGEQVYVVNKPGAFGNIGTAYAARQPADGYTLMMTAAGPIAINPALYDHAGFDPDKDFDPVALTSIVPMIIATNPSLGVRSLDDLIKVARSRPDKVDVAIPSVSSQLILEMLKQKNVPLFGVKYKGSGEAIAAVLGNQVPVLIDTVAAIRPQLRKLDAVAVTTPKAISLLPHVKSVAEQGLSGFSMNAWNVLMVPSGTPVAIRERLADEMRKVLALPETTKALHDLGLEEAPSMTHDELVAWMNSERNRYGEIIRSAHMKP